MDGLLREAASSNIAFKGTRLGEAFSGSRVSSAQGRCSGLVIGVPLNLTLGNQTMVSKLSPEDKRLYQAVDEVLHYIWDPIGVCDVPQARDEYHSYLPHVFSLLKSGVSEEEIAEYLGSVITDRMGLSANKEHDLKVINILTDWKESINEQLA